jgi:hypothetical protein
MHVSSLYNSIREKLQEQLRNLLYTTDMHLYIHVNPAYGSDKSFKIVLSTDREGCESVAEMGCNVASVGPDRVLINLYPRMLGDKNRWRCNNIDGVPANSQLILMLLEGLIDKEKIIESVMTT